MKEETTSHKTDQTYNWNDNPAMTTTSENKQTHPRGKDVVHF
jgi:hypothetical protein